MNFATRTFNAWRNSLPYSIALGGVIGSGFSKQRHTTNISNNILTNNSYTSDELYNNHIEDHYNTVSKGMASGFLLPLLPYWAYQEYVINANLRTLDYKIIKEHKIHRINRLLNQMPNIDHLEKVESYLNHH